MKTSKIIGLILGPALFLFLNNMIGLDGLSPEGHAVLGTAAWMALWWTMEVVPIAVTALLPLVLMPLTGALGIDQVTPSYGHKYVFLYMGGFIIAIAIEKWNLHRRIALNIINLMGIKTNRIILGFMAATAFLSMWISNTATAVMMLPIGMAIVTQLKDNAATKEDEQLAFGKALMLAIAYAASIGGIGTLIGTPPNLVLAGILEETYGTQITFMQWMLYGLPISILLLAACWYYLTRFAFKSKDIQIPSEFPGGRTEIRRLLNALGKMQRQERTVLIVFILTALCWISRSFLIAPFLPGVDDTVIAIFFSIVLFVLPTGKKNQRILTWEEAVKLPWGIILLFGGGLALATGFTSTGLAQWIGDKLVNIQGISLFVLVLILVASVNFLTEITSNVATTAMLLPIIVPVAVLFDTHPYLLMIGVTVAASCAFMLPVATPPNAIVFGSGYLRIPDMMKAGIWLNIFSIVLITLFTYFLLPVIWGIDISVFPAGFSK
ncbi:MAG: anion transporter [Cytophagaceae bacterium]|nr:anion transporter [Cytophagaceae bacterium]|tara:strand:+ start:16804 stop:18285 length:1482 start_codon:yes stop_codon:yes gene_type:complete